MTVTTGKALRERDGAARVAAEWPGSAGLGLRRSVREALSVAADEAPCGWGHSSCLRLCCLQGGGLGKQRAMHHTPRLPRYLQPCAQ